MGPKRFLTWSKENPIWWMSYRTVIPGRWNKEDVEEFNDCGAKYILFFDHTKENDARLFSLRVLERDDHFKAVKVSKFARDGEKIIVFLGKDGKRKEKIHHLAKQFDIVLWDVRGLDHLSPAEKSLDDKYSEYLKCLAMAFRGMEDGSVKVNGLQF